MTDWVTAALVLPRERQRGAYGEDGGGDEGEARLFR